MELPNLFKMGNAADVPLKPGAAGPVRLGSGILGGIQDLTGLNLNDEVGAIGGVLDKLFGGAGGGDLSSLLMGMGQQPQQAAMQAPPPRPLLQVQPLNFLNGLNMRRGL